jgi:RNA polymerase sigma-70 factor (ECF subfamily)
MGYENNNADQPNRAPDSTSTTLLARAKSRQPEAWQRLVEVYGPTIYRWCRQSGLSPEDASDVVQDVFASVVKSLGDFRGEQPCGSFRAWLRGISRHRIVDHFRNRQDAPQAAGGTGAHRAFLQVADSPEAPACSDPPGAADALWRRALNCVQAEFEQRTWQAFWRVVVDAQRPAEVAEELGMTLHAVYMAKSRVMRRVRQQLDDLEGQGQIAQLIAGQQVAPRVAKCC